jgi:hypothetical protein
MERLRFRSTSITDLQVELRERELLASVDHRRRAPERRHRAGPFGLPLAWRRRRPADHP